MFKGCFRFDDSKRLFQGGLGFISNALDSKRFKIRQETSDYPFRIERILTKKVAYP